MLDWRVDRYWRSESRSWPTRIMLRCFGFCRGEMGVWEMTVSSGGPVLMEVVSGEYFDLSEVSEDVKMLETVALSATICSAPGSPCISTAFLEVCWLSICSWADSSASRETLCSCSGSCILLTLVSSWSLNFPSCTKPAEYGGPKHESTSFPTSFMFTNSLPPN